MLELNGPSRRRQGFYWASVIVSIVVHGGFLAYVLVYARPQGQPQPRARAENVNVETIGAPPFSALPRGDRQATSLWEHMAEEAADSSALALADQIGGPLPEDGASAIRPLPQPEADGAPASQAPAETGIALPDSRLSHSPSEQKLSERRVADPQPDGGPTARGAIPLPPLKILAAPEKVADSDESRASVSDIGPQGSPVVAVLPKEAGMAMFAAHIVAGAQLLPEDHLASAAPAQAWPEPSLESHTVPPPARRVARLADTKRAQAERSVADDRKAIAYRADVWAHLAANRPAGSFGSGRAVVAFGLTPEGGVRSARIVRSSGRAALDQSVLQSVHRAEPYPTPPEGLKPLQLRFLVPFEFR